ncbi:MAG: ABC transporter permease [Spirochaetales bacterium]|nr:ABC transporter permease [Spirochaetales bacterium]
MRLLLVKIKRFVVLSATEFKLSLRSFDMVLFGLLMPIAIVIVIGIIYGGKDGGGAEMIGNSFGAYLAIGICAVGLMGLPLTLSDYRQKKILKRLAVTPAHPALLLGVQLFVQALVAIFSALLVTATGVVFYEYAPEGSPVLFFTAYLLVLVSIFSIGLCIASVASDAKKAGLYCSIAYFPMLLLSGTTVPFEAFPPGVQKVAAVLPLSQGIMLLNGISSGDAFTEHIARVIILMAIAGICGVVSVKTFRWDMESA